MTTLMLLPGTKLTSFVIWLSLLISTRAHIKGDLKSYVLQTLNETTVSSEPFPNLYVRHFLPPNLSQQLLRSWPSAKGKSFIPRGKMRSIGFSATHLRSEAKICALVAKKKRSKQWLDLCAVFTSKDVEAALFRKFYNSTKVKHGRFTFRLIEDQQKFYVGMHPDARSKLLTFQIYLPNQEQELENNYGTCLHTESQFSSKDAKTGLGECEVQFDFRLGSAYAFRPTKVSYHSVPMRGRWRGPRRTIILNWYR